MQLSFYNTRTRQKDVFVPLDPSCVKMYSCGPTVYSDPHIGNFKASFTADLLRNALKLFGYPVKAIMNITDVGHLSGDNQGDADHGEDRLEKGAKKEGLTAWDVAIKYERIFHDALARLHIDAFDVMPRATEHIKEQIDLVQILIQKGYTYVIPSDGIYMDTAKVPDYGKLMGPNYKKRLEGLQEGARVEKTDRKNPSDFALRKFSPDDRKRDMEWIFSGSRAGELITAAIVPTLTAEEQATRGFPGRHIECSAMSHKHLGTQFDIHHGGPEHITIHHTDEIAQSECAFGVDPWVTCRMHHGLLTVDGGKMGKSIGNVYTLDDLVAKGFSPLDLRMLYFQAQYRTTQDFSWEALTAAKKARENLQKKIRGTRDERIENREGRDAIYRVGSKKDTMGSKKDTMGSKKDTMGSKKDIMGKENSIPGLWEALADDLNTPTMLAAINTFLKNPTKEGLEELNYLDTYLLKLDLFSSQASAEKEEIPTTILSLAEQRKIAKDAKDWAEADRLRQEIETAGYIIKDIKDGREITKL